MAECLETAFVRFGAGCGNDGQNSIGQLAGKFFFPPHRLFHQAYGFPRTRNRFSILETIDERVVKSRIGSSVGGDIVPQSVTVIVVKVTGLKWCLKRTGTGTMARL